MLIRNWYLWVTSGLWCWVWWRRQTSFCAIFTKYECALFLSLRKRFFFSKSSKSKFLGFERFCHTIGWSLLSYFSQSPFGGKARTKSLGSKPLLLDLGAYVMKRCKILMIMCVTDGDTVLISLSDLRWLHALDSWRLHTATF